MKKKLLTVFDFEPTEEEWNALFPGISRKDMEVFYKEVPYTQESLYHDIIDLLLYRGHVKEAKVYMNMLPDTKINQAFIRMRLYPDMINLK